MVFRVLNAVYVLMWEQRKQRLRDKAIIYVCFFILFYVIYFTSHDCNFFVAR